MYCYNCFNIINFIKLKLKSAHLLRTVKKDIKLKPELAPQNIE